MAPVAEMEMSNLGRKESSMLMSMSPVVEVNGKGVRVDSLLFDMDKRGWIGLFGVVLTICMSLSHRDA